jgi:inorganic triphosphatase YgiF
LARRIDHFLIGLSRKGRDPNRLEGHYLLDALSHLHVNQYRLGEEAMRKAEQAFGATPQQLSSVKAAYDPMTAAHLRRQLDDIMARVSANDGD